jgi:hypothetical protein
MSGHQNIEGRLKFFTEKQELPKGTFTKITANAGIRESALRTWHQKGNAESREAWLPLADDHPQSRVFTGTTKNASADHIRLNFIESRIGVTRATVKMLGFDSYGAQDHSPVIDLHTRRFCFAISNGVKAYHYKTARERRATVEER